MRIRVVAWGVLGDRYILILLVMGLIWRSLPSEAPEGPGAAVPRSGWPSSRLGCSASRGVGIHGLCGAASRAHP